MAYSHVLLGAAADPAKITVRRIGFADLKDALSKGFDDFAAMPTHAVFLCAIYPVIGLVLARLAFGYSILPLLYPLATGFALVGPIAAIGIYELSRRREAGLDTSALHSLDVVQSSSIGAIVVLAILLSLIFLIWVAFANALYIATFGYAHTGFDLAVRARRADDAGRLDAHRRRQPGRPGVRRDRADHQRGVVPDADRPRRGCGGCAADVDPGGGGKSGDDGGLGPDRRHAAADRVMPAFLGLTVVIPVLGHATWHLYRKAVDAGSSERPNIPPPPPGRRYAADFPANLFPWARERER